MTENSKGQAFDTYFVGEWVIVDRRTIGTAVFPDYLLPGWMAMWREDVILSVNATLFVPAGTPMDDVVAEYEWHINADNARGDA